MEISEGSITLTRVIPVPEIILRKEALAPRFYSFIKSILNGQHSRSVAGGNARLKESYPYTALPDIEFEIGPFAGEVSNSWRYWFDTVESEVNSNCHYDYPVMYVEPGIDLNIPATHPEVVEESDVIEIRTDSSNIEVEDLKSRFWILIYPQGIIAIRLRLYFSSRNGLGSREINSLIHTIGDLRVPESQVASEDILENKGELLDHYGGWRHQVRNVDAEFDHPVDVLQNLIDQLSIDAAVKADIDSKTPKFTPLETWYSNIDLDASGSFSKTVTMDSPKLFSVVTGDVLSSVYNVGRSAPAGFSSPSEIPTYPLIYAYDAKEINKRDILKMYRYSEQEYSTEYVNRHISRRLGKYESDNIYITPFGSFVHTNAFDHQEYEVKRKHRLELMNSMYVGIDTGQFMNHLGDVIGRRLKEIDEDFVEGTLTGNPVDLITIKQIHDIILLSRNIGSLRKRTYDEIRPDGVEEKIESELEATVTRLANHDSDLRQAIKNSPLSFGLSLFD